MVIGSSAVLRAPPTALGPATQDRATRLSIREGEFTTRCEITPLLLIPCSWLACSNEMAFEGNFIQPVIRVSWNRFRARHWLGLVQQTSRMNSK